MEENNMTENINNKKGVNTLIPYFIALGGAILTVAASFIPYIKISGFFFSRKVSIFSLLIETLNEPDNMLKGAGDIVVICAIIAAVVFSLLVVLFTGIRKMIPAIVFIALTALPFLMISGAYIHFIGLAVSLGGAIWYLVCAPKKNK